MGAGNNCELRCSGLANDLLGFYKLIVRKVCSFNSISESEGINNTFLPRLSMRGLTMAKRTALSEKNNQIQSTSREVNWSITRACIFLLLLRSTQSFIRISTSILAPLEVLQQP